MVMAETNALAVAQFFSALASLASFAKHPCSAVAADDFELFCKLQSQLLRCNGAVL
jgi:hypothetical protein